MSGYHNYSMSNNAVEAYNNNEKPFSKWTKADFVKYNPSFKKYSLQTLKDNLLIKSSWHHTSSHFNKTDFYEIDETVTEIVPTKLTKPIEEMWNIEYLIWSGSRNHPKATVKTCECKIIGNWAFTPDGKKSITANGFKFISKTP